MQRATSFSVQPTTTNKKSLAPPPPSNINAKVAPQIPGSNPSSTSTYVAPRPDNARNTTPNTENGLSVGIYRVAGASSSAPSFPGPTTTMLSSSLPPTPRNNIDIIPEGSVLPPPIPLTRKSQKSPEQNNNVNRKIAPSPTAMTNTTPLPSALPRPSSPPPSSLQQQPQQQLQQTKSITPKGAPPPPPPPIAKSFAKSPTPVVSNATPTGPSMLVGPMTTPNNKNNFDINNSNNNSSNKTIMQDKKDFVSQQQQQQPPLSRHNSNSSFSKAPPPPPPPKMPKKLPTPRSNSNNNSRTPSVNPQQQQQSQTPYQSGSNKYHNNNDTLLPSPSPNGTLDLNNFSPAYPSWPSASVGTTKTLSASPNPRLQQIQNGNYQDPLHHQVLGQNQESSTIINNPQYQHKQNQQVPPVPLSRHHLEAEQQNVRQQQEAAMLRRDATRASLTQVPGSAMSIPENSLSGVEKQNQMLRMLQEKKQQQQQDNYSPNNNNNNRHQGMISNEKESEFVRANGRGMMTTTSAAPTSTTSATMMIMMNNSKIPPHPSEKFLLTEEPRITKNLVAPGTSSSPMRTSYNNNTSTNNVVMHPDQNTNVESATELLPLHPFGDLRSEQIRKSEEAASSAGSPGTLRTTLHAPNQFHSSGRKKQSPPLAQFSYYDDDEDDEELDNDDNRIFGSAASPSMPQLSSPIRQQQQHQVTSHNNLMNSSPAKLIASKNIVPGNNRHIDPETYTKMAHFIGSIQQVEHVQELKHIILAQEEFLQSLLLSKDSTHDNNNNSFGASQQKNLSFVKSPRRELHDTQMGFLDREIERKKLEQLLQDQELEEQLLKKQNASSLRLEISPAANNYYHHQNSNGNYSSPRNQQISPSKSPPVVQPPQHPVFKHGEVVAVFPPTQEEYDANNYNEESNQGHNQHQITSASSFSPKIKQWRVHAVTEEGEEATVIVNSDEPVYVRSPQRKYLPHKNSNSNNNPAVAELRHVQTFVSFEPILPSTQNHNTHDKNKNGNKFGSSANVEENNNNNFYGNQGNRQIEQQRLKQHSRLHRNHQLQQHNGYKQNQNYYRNHNNNHDQNLFYDDELEYDDDPSNSISVVSPIKNYYNSNTNNFNRGQKNSYYYNDDENVISPPRQQQLQQRRPNNNNQHQFIPRMYQQQQNDNQYYYSSSQDVSSQQAHARRALPKRGLSTPGEY